MRSKRDQRIYEKTRKFLEKRKEENIDEKIESIQDNNKEKKENVAEPNENQSQNEEDKKL